MKTLLIIRHAKSGWSDPSLPDFDRTLTDRGKEDASLMAKRVLRKNIPVDLFVSSPAKRAKKTAKIFMKEYGSDDEKLFLEPLLYEAGVKEFYKVIEEVDDRNSHVAVFAHNPGITDFVNSLQCVSIYDMPVCGVYALSIHTGCWKEWQAAKKEFLFFDYPGSAG